MNSWFDWFDCALCPCQIEVFQLAFALPSISSLGLQHADSCRNPPLSESYYPEPSLVFCSLCYLWSKCVLPKQIKSTLTRHSTQTNVVLIGKGCILPSLHFHRRVHDTSKCK